MWSLINKNIREIIKGLTDFRLIKYSEAGDYTITLTLTNTCSSASDTINFSILDGLATNFDIPSCACLDPDFSFTPNNTSTGDEPQYAWAINGPGNPTINNATAEEPTITIFAPGEYVVGLTVSNAACQASIHRDPLQVNAPPDITLSPIPAFVPAAAYYQKPPTTQQSTLSTP